VKYYAWCTYKTADHETAEAQNVRSTKRQKAQNGRSSKRQKLKTAEGTKWQKAQNGRQFFTFLYLFYGVMFKQKAILTNNYNYTTT
jgi:hypothetical protein